MAPSSRLVTYTRHQPSEGSDVGTAEESASANHGMTLDIAFLLRRHKHRKKLQARVGEFVSRARDGNEIRFIAEDRTLVISNDGLWAVGYMPRKPGGVRWTRDEEGWKLRPAHAKAALAEFIALAVEEQRAERAARRKRRASRRNRTRPPSKKGIRPWSPPSSSRSKSRPSASSTLDRVPGPSALSDIDHWWTGKGNPN